MTASASYDAVMIELRVRFRKMEWFNDQEQVWGTVATVAEGPDGSLA